MPEPLDDSAATSRGPWEGDRETEQERLNPELDQLVSELRVALPGIQVLLAFLLTVPFTTRFHDLSTSARDVYFAAVTLVATSSVLLIAPTVHHRMRFRDGTKEEMIYAANRLALGRRRLPRPRVGRRDVRGRRGRVPGGAARWIGPFVTLLAAGLWFALPLRFRGHPRRPLERTPEQHRRRRPDQGPAVPSQPRRRPARRRHPKEPPR